MSNKASWLPEPKQQLKVDSAEYYKPGAGEILVKNAAVAVNPVDWKVQDSGHYIKKWPNVLGCDVAGEVVETGSDVKNVKKGQRVLGYVGHLHLVEQQ